MVQKLLFAFSGLFLSLLGGAQTVWNGPTITFTKAASGNVNLAANQDRITASTWITRGNVQGIFNIAPGKETFYTHNSSPSNTEWATGSLANYASLVYKSWEEWAGGKPNVDDIAGKSAVVHLIAENIYLGITFLTWGVGGGSGGFFSYQRTTAGTPAPVKLVSFTAARKNNTVALQWKTASEENTSTFSVERSADGKDFSSIGTLVAAGNSQAEKLYSFTDVAPQSINFYRLRTNDKDGSFSYSTIVAFKVNKLSSLQLSPNPANASLYLQYSANEKGEAQILDPAGRVVRRIILSAGENALTVDIAALKAGVYILRAEGESRTFVKQ